MKEKLIQEILVFLKGQEENTKYITAILDLTEARKS